MRCPNCQHQNPAFARFCANCGQSFPTDEQPTASQPVSTGLPAALQPTGDLFAAPATAPQGAGGYVAPQAGAASSMIDSGYGPNPTQLPPQPQSPPPGYQPYQAQPPQFGPYAQPSVASFNAVPQPQPVPPYVPTRRASFAPFAAALTVALIALLGVGGWLLFANNRSGNEKINGQTANATAANPTAAAVTTIPPIDPSVITVREAAKGGAKDKLVQLINDSNAAQTEAMKTLNVDLLKQFYVGEEYNKNRDMVGKLKSENAYSRQKLEKIDILEVVIDGDKATAKTVEVWSQSYYRKDNNQLLQDFPATTLDEVYHFTRQNGQWIIERVDIVDRNATPDSSVR